MNGVQFPQTGIAHRLMRDFVCGICRPDDVVDFPDFDMGPVDHAEQIFALCNMHLVANTSGDAQTHPMHGQSMNNGQFYSLFFDSNSHDENSPVLPHARRTFHQMSGIRRNKIRHTPHYYCDRLSRCLDLKHARIGCVKVNTRVVLRDEGAAVRYGASHRRQITAVLATNLRAA